uniref:NAD(+) diphosphatase n=1 Tax=Strongyloides venezuelensis TaxID=75913 RepID=A0A0K0FHV5_STRVS
MFKGNVLIPLTKYIRSFSSLGTSKYVDKIHIYNLWKDNCNELEKHYPKGKAIVLLDRDPLIKSIKGSNITSITPELMKFDYIDIAKKLDEYGLDVGRENTVLLDVIPPEGEGQDYKPFIGISMSLNKPDPDSRIDFIDVKKSLANDLGGECLSLRMCILAMKYDDDRNYLAKLQSTMKWHRTFRLCPYCGGVLIKKLSKASCKCTNCTKTFYPTINPVSMIMLTDSSNKHCLLVRHSNSVKGVFTTITGFANPGETLKSCAKREVAEEIGLECHNIRGIDYCQPWPMPDNSLIVPFYGVAEKDAKLTIETNEIQSAKWFTRQEVLEALERVNNDPFLKKLPSLIENDKEKYGYEVDNRLYYIPPHGALAYNLIKFWAEKSPIFTGKNAKKSS